MGRISYRKTGVALAASVGLASGAHALGSQAGDGTAQAARGGPTTAAQGARGLDPLASRLGVSEAKLRAALEDLRDEQPAPRDRREDMAAELAKELGVDQAKVEAAFARIRERHEAEHEQRRAAFAAALARKLGVSEAKVTEALQAAGGFRGPGGHHRRGRGTGGPPPGP